VPTGSIQVFAQWTSVAIDVLTFDPNGGTGSVAPYSGENGSSTALPTIDGITNPGFAFSGWNTQANGGGTQYAEGESLTLSSSQTLYAQWTAGPSDTLTFNANGGSGSIDPINGTPGSTVTLPDQSGLIRAGFELIRWNTSATGKGISYSVGQGIKLSGSIVLYAQWKGHKVATLFGAIGTFKAGSYSLSAALKSQINRIAFTIKSRKYVKVELFGYTAATGLRSLNISLSRSRARNVANFLRNRLNELKVRGVTISSTGEGAITGQSSNAYSRVEVFGV
jgi:outer membrane protein OmpA-like peptidoglycan-associated protein